MILAHSVLGCGGQAQSTDEPSSTKELKASAWDVTVVATPTAPDPTTQDSPNPALTFHFTLDLIGEPANLWGALSQYPTARSTSG
ncbi:MAG: hypothetical protein ABI488_19265 [Polyangiaceae bacterium]